MVLNVMGKIGQMVNDDSECLINDDLCLVLTMVGDNRITMHSQRSESRLNWLNWLNWLDWFEPGSLRVASPSATS